MKSETVAASMPWGELFGLLFMTMGPIRAIATFSVVERTTPRRR